MGSRELECVEKAPHPKPALRSGFDLSPAGRGELSVVAIRLKTIVL